MFFQAEKPGMLWVIVWFILWTESGLLVNDWNFFTFCE